MATLLGSPKVQYFKTGTVDYLVGGKIYSYDAGTLTPRYTYPTIADAIAGTNANSNPIILDARGEADVVINGATKIVLTDALGNEIWSVDNLDQSSTGTNIVDSNGNSLLRFVGIPSAVNDIIITNAATGNKPSIKSGGTDTNVGLLIDGQGSGTIDVGTTSTGAINLKRDTAITGTLTASGNATLSGTLALTGLATLSGGITVPAGQVINFLPAGTIAWKASTNVPTGWLECNGATVSRTSFAALFADIGTTYGAGDGSTTFLIPVSARRTLVGRGGSGTATLANTVGATGGTETHTLITAEIPAHTHTYSAASSSTNATGGATNVLNNTGSNNSGSTGGDGAHNNMQPSMVMMMIIKS